MQATTCKGTLQAFNILTCLLDLDPLDHRNFYSQLKSKVNTWKAKALWHKLDKRGSHKEYKRGKACMNTKVRGTPQTFPMGRGAGELVSPCHLQVLNRCACGCYLVVLRGRLPLSGRGAMKLILLWWPHLPLCTFPKGGNQKQNGDMKQMPPLYLLLFLSLHPCCLWALFFIEQLLYTRYLLSHLSPLDTCRRSLNCFRGV